MDQKYRARFWTDDENDFDCYCLGCNAIMLRSELIADIWSDDPRDRIFCPHCGHSVTDSDTEETIE